MKEDKSEEKKEWKPSGRILEDKELKEWQQSFQDIEDSIKGLKETKRGK